MVKKQLEKKVKSDFYLTILNELKLSTNLSKIQEKLKISKQNLYYYLRELKKDGYIIKKERGWYEPTEKSKNLTKYHSILKKDISRGHAYIWTVKFPKEIEKWKNRVEVLRSKDIHFKLVGALKDVPRIKILGRKIWLCNNHLRIFDRKNASYYGKDAKESRYLAFHEIKLIVGVLNNKLGVFLKPSQINFQREHYSLINNDLAIEENTKKNIWHIKDEEGEWLLIDDSMGEGGELENIGKKAFQTNIPMQKWWNDNKKHDFQISPTFILNRFNETNNSINSLVELQKDLPKNLQLLSRQIESHLKLIQEYRNENISWRKHTIKQIKEELKLGKQTTLNDFGNGKTKNL